MKTPTILILTVAFIVIAILFIELTVMRLQDQQEQMLQLILESQRSNLSFDEAVTQALAVL